MISGEFTNWKPTRMVRIDEYAFSLDPDTGKQGLDFFDILRSKGSVSPQTHKDVKLLAASELDTYNHFKEETMDFYNKNWAEYLGENILYKKPFMGNAQYLSEIKHPLGE